MRFRGTCDGKTCGTALWRLLVVQTRRQEQQLEDPQQCYDDVRLFSTSSRGRGGGCGFGARKDTIGGFRCRALGKAKGRGFIPVRVLTEQLIIR